MAMPGGSSPGGFGSGGYAGGGFGGGGGYHDNAPLVSNNQYGGGAGGMSPHSYGPQGGGPGGQGGPGYNPGAGYPPAGGPGPGYYDQEGTRKNTMAMAMGGNHMNDVYFGAAMCIVVGSLLGGFSLFFSLKTVDWIQMTYLLLFGLALAVLDTPFLKTIKMVMDLKIIIGKYLTFVTRVTGKGVTLMFLGSAQFMTMWDNLEGGFMRFLAVILSLFPALVGMASVVIGLLKSSKLDRAKRQLQLVIEQRYDYFAQTYRGPTGGLTMAEFNLLTMENGGFKFETLDLKLIFNALVSNPMWRINAGQGGQNANTELKIPKSDLVDWTNGGMVLL
mmetsp:Transcript_25936/g.78079  ORF Transcript_25936/g.78079 Transcript_25936/m.78079 type:complete len:332 (-) Transcript_25936:168-1163(-)